MIVCISKLVLLSIMNEYLTEPQLQAATDHIEQGIGASLMEVPLESNEE
jgi:hypothetical protein